MSSTPKANKYRPEAGKPFPFPKSGSKWTLEELNFIGLDHKLDCDLDDIIPPRIILSPKITEYLSERLIKPWEDLLLSRFEQDRETFYARLLQVAGPKSEVVPYDIPDTSSQPTESTPPPQVEEPTTPERDPNLVQPPRPNPQHNHMPGCLSSSPVSPILAKSTGILPEASPNTSSDWTPQPSSDPSYEPSSPRVVESDSYREAENGQAKKDQAEKDVEALSRSLLYLIENAVTKALPSIVTDTRDPPLLYFMIGGSLMSTHPDIAINIQIGDEKPEIYVEATKKPDELTGQEIAHMIGTTFAFMRDVKEQDKYITYLISWHHTECYFSRLDITNKDLRQLIEEEVGNRSHDLNVKRSRIYDVIDHNERFEVAKAIVRILVLEVKKHSRSLARHLQT